MVNNNASQTTDNDIACQTSNSDKNKSSWIMVNDNDNANWIMVNYNENANWIMVNENASQTIDKASSIMVNDEAKWIMSMTMQVRERTMTMTKTIG